ncbi:hypothetical protein ACI65C_012950 [Semiaphis heraclei]
MKCCIPGCSSKRKHNSSLTPKSYFSFSKDDTRKYRLCSLHFEDIMFSNYQKNRIKPDAIPTIFPHLADEVPIVGHLNDCENTPSCSMSITSLSAVNKSVTTSDASTSFEIEVSSMGVQTPKHLSANTPRKLRLHERLVEEIKLRKKSEDREQSLLDKVNSLSLQLAERYSIDYTLKVGNTAEETLLFTLVDYLQFATGAMFFDGVYVARQCCQVWGNFLILEKFDWPEKMFGEINNLRKFWRNNTNPEKTKKKSEIRSLHFSLIINY